MATLRYPAGTIAVLRIQHNKQRDLGATIRRALEFFREQGIAYSPAPGNLADSRQYTDFFIRSGGDIEAIRDRLVGYFLEFSDKGPWWINVRRPYYPN